MDKQRVRSIFVILVCVPIFSYGQYQIPEIKFEAFSPRGLRVSIPAEPGVELFAFHGKINKPLLQIQPGDISQDITKPVNGRFSYVDTNVKLKKNDEINYWVFVQHDQLGFRKDAQSWKVRELLPIENLQTSCSASITKATGRDRICTGDQIIHYQFSEKPINPKVWLIDQYISGNPDWLFNIYQNSPDVIDIQGGVLHIKPKLEEENARKNLDLNPGCTRRDSECIRNAIVLNPPIVSGKLQSKATFAFANITIKAKLPIGDYIYPELYLQDVRTPERRIVLAYARGNKDYRQSNNNDIGGKTLFGGPYTNVTEPLKSTYLSSYQNTEHIGESWHTFNAIWKPDTLDLFMDGTHFGHHDAQTLQATGFNNDNIMVHLVLGVGAGGPFEFPDGFTSSGEKKPYGSFARNSIKEFLTNKAKWINTWSKVSQLQIEYVTVTAL